LGLSFEEFENCFCTKEDSPEKGIDSEKIVLVITTIRRISLSPQPHIVLAAVIHREKRSSKKDACFQSDSLLYYIFVMISLDVNKLEINNSSFTLQLAPGSPRNPTSASSRTAAHA
jgi:hypothetical protein